MLKSTRPAWRHALSLEKNAAGARGCFSASEGARREDQKNKCALLAWEGARAPSGGSSFGSCPLATPNT